MKIPSIVSTNMTKFISGLGNNEDSLTAMVIKDWIGDGATVYTYKKEGGKDDAREKAIEEFGTGLVWLFGIPFLKKVIDKTVYPLFKADADFDPRVLSNNNADNFKKVSDILAKSSDDALKSQKDLFASLGEKNKVLNKFTNAQMFKGLAVGKFAVATALSAVALAAIIKFKQKTTSDRISSECQIDNSEPPKTNKLLQNSVNKNEVFAGFTSKNASSKPISFKGLSEVMYNPIKNTMILDGVIATTRLAEARKGERKEVLLKELFQVGFIYGLALPIQRGFEFIGRKIGKPIDVDYKVLAMDGLADKIKASKDSIKALKDSDDVITTLSKMDVKNPLMQILDNDGAISTIKDNKGNIKALDYRKLIDEKAIKDTLNKIENLSPKLAGLKGIKAFKIFASLANVLIAAGVMGILQPKINIWMRKIMNHGDNRNPAIVAQEREFTNSKKVA
ncbi:hypothetical protein IJ425_03690 [bacterium]|nr:hypothetical protein [bacterium]